VDDAALGPGSSRSCPASLAPARADRTGEGRTTSDARAALALGFGSPRKGAPGDTPVALDASRPAAGALESVSISSSEKGSFTGSTAGTAASPALGRVARTARNNPACTSAASEIHGASDERPGFRPRARRAISSSVPRPEPAFQLLFRSLPC
jgi:hypothetical protein